MRLLHKLGIALVIAICVAITVAGAIALISLIFISCLPDQARSDDRPSPTPTPTIIQIKVHR